MPMPFFSKRKGGDDDAAAAGSSSVPGNSDAEASAHSNQPLFARESATAVVGASTTPIGGGGSVLNIESSSRPSSQRPPRSLILEPRVSRSAGVANLARASVDLARDLAREFVEPPVQTSTLVRRHVAGGGGEGGEGVNGDVGAAKAAATVADLESAPSGVSDGGNGLDGSLTKQHGRPVHRTLTPLELEGMPKGTCEDGIRRRGNTFSATMHVITAIIGAGVLSLPAAMLPLGYAGGTICFIVFGLITVYTAHLLADCYCINGLRQRTYTELVDTVFGRKGEIAVAWIQLVNLLLTAWPYQILGAKTMAALAKEACSALGKESCPMDKYFIMNLIFGAIQLPFSMVPSLEHLEWASVVGTVASAIYSAAAFGLSASKFGKGPVLGSVWGSPEADAWSKLSAIGTILFSLSFAYILVEIQDTLHGDGTPRGPIRPMKRACNWAIGTSVAVYYAVACAGYSVFGDTDANVLRKHMPDDILTGFDGPRWVIIASNVAVLVHMLPAYQVWSQPFFEFFEHWRDRKAEITGRNPLALSPMKFRFALRTGYVVAGTLVTCAIPSLSIILGLAGALAFWPATVLFPIEAYVKVFKPRPAVKRSLRALNVLCALLTVAVAVSGVQQIVTQASQFKIFKE